MLWPPSIQCASSTHPRPSWNKNIYSIYLFSLLASKLFFEMNKLLFLGPYHQLPVHGFYSSKTVLPSPTHIDTSSCFIFIMAIREGGRERGREVGGKVARLEEH